MKTLIAAIVASAVSFGAAGVIGGGSTLTIRARDLDVTDAAAAGRCRYRDNRVPKLTAWHGQVCRGRTSAGSAIVERGKECC